jgi:ATP-dependent Clp endopeptidase proteolytic subunit ClpP
MKHDYARRLQALTGADRRQPRAEAPKVDVDNAGAVATMRLYDAVDSWGEWWGISAKEIATALDELPDTVQEIRLHINSPGGEVFEGIAIMNALRAHPARVVAIVDGIAASIASVIAVGADELVMARNSELMIHDAWGLCVGNAADMTAMAELLDHLSDNIASVYADKTGGDPADWRAAMAKESWYSAQEAVDAGLADSVETKTTAAKNRYDLTIFTYAGRSAAPAPDTTTIAERKPTPAPADEAPTTPVRVDEFRQLVATTLT